MPRLNEMRIISSISASAYRRRAAAGLRRLPRQRRRHLATLAPCPFRPLHDRRGQGAGAADAFAAAKVVADGGIARRMKRRMSWLAHIAGLRAQSSIISPAMPWRIMRMRGLLGVRDA